jgi:hypothetical protein
VDAAHVCRENATVQPRVAAASAVATLALVAAACGGGGEPSQIDGVTSYDAAGVARDAMDDEVLEKDSLAYGRTLVVGGVHVDQLDGGQVA